MADKDTTRDGTTPGLDRRHFLLALSGGGGVAAVALLPGEAAADSETADEKLKARYQESEHVQTYYRVNRY